MIGLNITVFALPAVQGARRAASRCRSSASSPSEFGMMLLILALSAFAVERSRRMSERRTTGRILLLGLIPAMIVMPQSDLGTADLRR